MQGFAERESLWAFLIDDWQEMKKWEKKTGRQYYELSAAERTKANEEISKMKREGVLFFATATTAAAAAAGDGG